MTNFKVWISSFRLRTLPLSISGILIGSSFAYAEQSFNNTIFLLALLTTVSLQILSNLANDYGDGVKGTDNNNRIGPERAIQSGVITPDKMKSAEPFSASSRNLLSLGSRHAVMVCTISIFMQSGH